MKSFLLIGLLFVTIGVFGQDKVELKNNKVRLNGTKISVGEYVKLPTHNEQSLQKAKSAQSLRTISSIVGFSGGFLVGYGFGQISSNNGYLNNSGGVIYTGLGLVAVSIPLRIIGNSDLKKSMNLHNGTTKTSINLEFKGNGLTLGYSF